MILRINSPAGITRIEVEPANSIAQLYQQISDKFQFQKQFQLSKEQSGVNPLLPNSTSSLESSGLKNGDFVYVIGVSSKDLSENREKESRNQVLIKEDEIDRIIEQKDGLIERTASSKQFCAHSTKGTCESCLPLEPYDAGYSKEHKIKHLSYHAYLRKLGLERPSRSFLTEAQTKGALISSLEEPDYRPKRCPYHSANGMCTKCQIGAIVLQQQQFRMVDHVEFQSSSIIDSCIGYWRKTGYQRFGMMYGYYTEYDKVPLGIKAVVCAIYEPLQDCSVDGFELIQNDSGEEELWNNALLQLTQKMSLVPVGMIFTDLQDDSSGTGKVLNKRNKDTFFISGFEAVFSAQMQAQYPSPSKHAPSGHFGSKFVSVVVSADETGSIDLFPYQVSNSCVAMTQASLILPTMDPALLKVVDEQDEVFTYIPEVFYKYRNEYGVEVQQAAKPTFPVDYLVVSLTHGFPSNPNPLFLAPQSNTAPFPGPHRAELNDRPSIQQIGKYLFGQEYSLSLFCDFNLILFMTKCEFLNPTDLGILIEAIREKSNALFEQFLVSPSWLSLALVLEDESSTGQQQQQQQQLMDVDQDFNQASNFNQPASNEWICSHCTFLNSNRTNDCEMCALPR